MGLLEDKIKGYAHELGFSHAGICTVKQAERVPFLDEWVKRGFHGEMKYMENPARQSMSDLFEWIHSIVVVAMNYRWPKELDDVHPDAVISKYAWAADYHAVMKPLLLKLGEFLQQMGGPATRAYVDTGPVVEKYWAMKAGLGWIGKHTNVISTHGSSWIFLGVALTDLKLTPDAPAQDHCGTCSRCITACPTGAIVAPYVLDARLCISYLTIELRGSIPRHLRVLIGNRIFGCDDCQDVCPWNRFAFEGDSRFAPRPEVISATLRDYLSLTPEDFRVRFKGTNVLRAKYRGFIRNCLVAAGNARCSDLKNDIRRHLSSEDEMIREHAVWALAQYGDEDVKQTLRELACTEGAESVLAEIHHSLGGS